MPESVIKAYEDHGDHVTATLSSGDRVEGRALIACDGMWSTIRSASSRVTVEGRNEWKPVPPSNGDVEP